MVLSGGASIGHKLTPQNLKFSGATTPVRLLGRSFSCYDNGGDKLSVITQIRYGMEKHRFHQCRTMTQAWHVLVNLKIRFSRKTQPV
jgi:hypothetical protein